MRYVLDTNVVAFWVRGRNPQVGAWTASVPVGEDLAGTRMAHPRAVLVIGQEATEKP